MTFSKKLSARNFDAIGVERARGKSFFFAPRGQKAGFFADGDGDFSAKLFFPENAKRLFFVRAKKSARRKITLEISLEKNAEIIFITENFEKKGDETEFFLKTKIAKNAKITILFFHFSDGKSRVAIENRATGDDAAAEIATAFFGKNAAENKISVENIAAAKNFSGEIKMRAALSGAAFCEMAGAPTIEKSAEKTRNFLDQKTLLLGKNSKIRAFPILKVKNSKVAASHKSSLLRLFSDDFFYLKSRGISEKTAKKLLQKSFLTAMTAKIPDKNLRGEISEFAEKFFEKSAKKEF